MEWSNSTSQLKYSSNNWYKTIPLQVFTVSASKKKKKTRGLEEKEKKKKLCNDRI